MYAIFWKRTEEDRTRALTADRDALERLSISMCPWNEKSPPQPDDDDAGTHMGHSGPRRDGADETDTGIVFDARPPELWQLTGCYPELCKHFQQTLIMKLLNVLLAMGEEGSKEAFEVAFFFSGKYEEVPEITDIEVCMYSCLQLWRAVCELARPDVSRHYGASVEWTFDPSHTGHVGVCRNVLTEIVFWKKCYEQFVGEMKFQDLRAKVPKSLAKIRSIDLGGGSMSDAMTALDEQLKLLGSCQAHLRRRLTSPFQEALQAKVEEVGKHIVQQQTPAPATSAEVDQLINLWKAAMVFFDHSDAMPSLVRRRQAAQGQLRHQHARGRLTRGVP